MGWFFLPKSLLSLLSIFLFYFFLPLFIPPKRRFGKDEQNVQKMKMKSQSIFCSSLQHLRLGSIKLRHFVFAIPGESDAVWRTQNGAIFGPRVKSA
jgi:hypothetical protein